MDSDKIIFHYIRDMRLKGNVSVGDELHFYTAKARHFERVYKESGCTDERSNRKAINSKKMAVAILENPKLGEHCDRVLEDEKNKWKLN